MKPRIRDAGEREALLALLGKNKVESSPEWALRGEERKTGPMPQFAAFEKGRKESSSGANKSILSSLGLTTRDIPHRSQEDLEEFLEKLEDVCKRRSTDDGKGQAQEIFFSTLYPELKTVSPGGGEYFSPNSLRIFASFSSNTDLFRDLDRVLVKWFNPGGHGDMIQYMEITPNSNYNYIWRELNYWDPGIYNVEIYRIGQDVTVLASGSYFVQDLREYFSYAGLYRDLNQYLSQADFQLGDPVYVKLNYASPKDQKLTLIVRNFDSGTPLVSRDMVIPAAQRSSAYLLKGPSESLPRGMYWLELWAENGLMVGRTRFGIN
jgi:hypothetical protein